MTDYNELMRLAEAASNHEWFADDWSDDFGDDKTTIGFRTQEVIAAGNHGIWPEGIQWHRVASTEEGENPLADAAFIAAANPSAVLALIAEKDAMAGLLKRFVDGEHEQDENQAERHMYFTEAQSLLALVSGELEAHTIVPESAIKAAHSERDQLRAEVAGLKTGYEAYERVNAELKAEVERLDKLLIDAAGMLRKASSWICRDVEVGTKSATHWAIRLRETADQIDAALGQGEQS